MKNSLSKVLLWGTVLSFFLNNASISKPVQLIPGKEQDAVDLPQADSSPMPEFWEGTPPSIVETYFPKLPLKLTSPLLRQLRAHLLKEPYPNATATYDKALLALMIGSGELEQAKEFLVETNLPDREALLVDLQWLTGNVKKACETVSNLVRTSSQSQWKLQNIYCLYKNGEEERAKVSNEVLAESDRSSAQFMSLLFDSSVKPPFDQTIAKSPFLLTVWLESKQALRQEDLDTLSPTSLALIVHSEKAALTNRRVAALLGLEQGLIKANEVITFLKEATPEAKFDESGLRSAIKEGVLPFGLIAQMSSATLASISPSQETLSLAHFISRAALLTSQKTIAKKWGTFLMREAPEEAVSLLPLLHLAFPEIMRGPSQVQAWQAYQSTKNATTAPQRSYELRRILEALGEPSGEPMKGEPSSPSWRQEKGILNAQEAELLKSAGMSQRKGEALLLALVLIGETPLREVPVEKLVPLLHTLKQVGYTEEARSLALEYLLVRGE